MYPVVIIALIVGIILGLGIFYYLSKKGEEHKLNTKAENKYSEVEAERLLARRGYQILARQPKRNIITAIDGQEHYGYLAADYLVRRGKERFVVVVKLGEGPADPNEPVFRRRLIEYDHVFSVDAILILDLEQGELRRVNFVFPKESRLDSFIKFVVVLLVILAVLGIIWLLAILKLI